MKKLIDLPIGLLLTLDKENPMFFDWITMNEISGAILYNGGESE